MRMTVSRTICLGFLVVITMGTLLLLLPLAIASGTWASPLVALFTATSAVCVTGLVVVDTGTYFSPFGQAVIVALIQIGGQGYMTATTQLLQQPLRFTCDPQHPALEPHCEHCRQSLAWKFWSLKL
jgi:trk system potassium uptake protein TrkH